jgi:ribonuclease D
MDGLYKTLTGKILNKELQTSDWNLKNLSLTQQDYAALDAIVSIILYDLM